jgi:hypothetical protein
MKLLITTLVLFFGLIVQLHAQTSINRKDIVIVNETKTLNEKDQNKLANYNFDEFRYLNLRKKIQLVNGPLIELLSLSELKSLGINVKQETSDLISKKSEKFKHESILQLNIGLGIHEAYEPK